MFERGPNGYWFEWTYVDEVVFITLGLLMVVYGFLLITKWDHKFDYMGPIIGMFLFGPGMIMCFGQILYLLGVPM